MSLSPWDIKIVLFFALPLCIGTVLVAHNLIMVMFDAPFEPSARTLQL
jgi:O-antigen/teichoic acid export membrane protein